MSQLLLSPSKFDVVKFENGKICTEDGTVYLQQKSDGQIFSVEVNENLKKLFNIVTDEDTSESVDSTICINQGIATSAEEAKRIRRWSREAILMLLDIRIKRDSEFKRTTMKKEVLWNKIAAEMQQNGYNVSASQCNDKWRYLKARYTQKKDNMGAKGTGEPPMDCEFFEILDTFLRCKHNIKPVAVASSTRGDNNILIDNAEEALEETEHPPIKKKKITSNITNSVKNKVPPTKGLLDLMKQSAIQREENRERRHQDLIVTRNRAIDVFGSKMDLLLETLKKDEAES